MILMRLMMVSNTPTYNLRIVITFFINCRCSLSMKVEILLYLAITNNHYFDMLGHYNPNPKRVELWAVRVQIFRLWFFRFLSARQEHFQCFYFCVHKSWFVVTFFPARFELGYLKPPVKADLHLQWVKVKFSRKSVVSLFHICFCSLRLAYVKKRKYCSGWTLLSSMEGEDLAWPVWFETPTNNTLD